MDSDEYRDYLYSKRWLRDQVLILCAVVVGFAIIDRLGIIDVLGLEGGAPRAYAVQLGALLIVGMWLVVAVIGVVGLFRWLRE